MTARAVNKRQFEERDTGANVPGKILTAVALFGAAALGIRGVEFVTLIALFAAPCAINSFNMAMQMGGNKDLAASAVMTTSALSFFTLFIWVTLFKMLGMF